ncbi:MAG: tetratricopeptide repeat protein [Planctomycetota bacterium]
MTNGRRLALWLLGVLVLCAGACCVYVPTLRYEMIFDDQFCIVENESIHQLFPLFGTDGGYGPLNPQPHTPVEVRPLVSLSLAINYHLGQLDPFGYRAAHVALHLLTTIILWVAIALTLRQPSIRQRFGADRDAIAFLGAFLWMVHPVHTETVIYLTQRTELMMGFFYALTLLLAIVYWKCESVWSRVIVAIAAMLASVCGMLSKEMMASIPAMVLVYEWTFIGGSILKIVKRSWLLYVSLCLSCIPLVALYAMGVGTPGGGFNNTISAYDYWLTSSNTFFGYWALVWKPWPLLVHHHIRTLTSLSAAWPGVLGLGVYACITVIALWRRYATGFVLLWFFAVLSPTLIIPLPHEEFAERRLYVPLLTAVPFLAIAAYMWIARRFDRDATTARRPWTAQLLSAAPLAAAVIVLAGISNASSPRLKVKEELWEHVLEHQPDNMFAIASQGAVQFNRGETDEGLEKMVQAYRTDPGYDFFRTLLIRALTHAQDHERFLEYCLEMHQSSPNEPTCAHNLATAFEKDGRYLDAIEQYKRAIQLDKSNWMAHASVGTLLSEQNQVGEAILHFEAAVELHPDFMNCMNLMGLYISTRQNKKAIRVTSLLLEAARKEKTPDVVARIERGLRELERMEQLRGPTL